jgi:hypothetical protein
MEAARMRLASASMSNRLCGLPVSLMRSKVDSSYAHLPHLRFGTGQRGGGELFAYDCLGEKPAAVCGDSSLEMIRLATQ